MKKYKEKTDFAVSDIVDKSKPTTKPFVDADREIIRSIELCLEHIPHSVIKIIPVYKSKDARMLRFRVNFWSSVIGDGDFTPKNKITGSRYVQVNIIGDKYEVIDMTQ